MEKAFGYCRVSSKGQIDGDGLVRQEKAIRDYAEKNGFSIERIFSDQGVSGTLEARPALAELMVSLEQNGHGIKTVIIERVDRLARDLMVQENIIADLQKHGFTLISTLEDDLCDNDPTRKLVRQVLGSIAEYDKTMLVLKLRAARERKRLKNGKCEGRKGYTEAMPEIVREIKRLRRARKGQTRRTYESIANELNSRGLQTMNGGSFTATICRNIVSQRH